MDGVEERIANREERVHILTGAICNNNCIFCMEEDRDARYVTNSATTDERVAWVLDQNRGCEEVCFTSGEPTTNKRLPAWARMAKDAGVRKISVMTNARALAYDRYARALFAAGINRFYVSIHGHTQKLHEGLTRTPKSFEQTVAGIKNIARLKGRTIDLHTSTVVTRRNLPEMGNIYRFLRSLGVDQVVFNVMQANGRADTYFDQLWPTYTQIAEGFAAFIEEQSQREEQVQAFLVDIPLCTTEAVPDFNRGYVERYIHFEPAATTAHDIIPADSLTSRMHRDEDEELLAITRGDLDGAEREKKPSCARCKYDDNCEGVWRNYTARMGWDEFQPIEAD